MQIFEVFDYNLNNIKFKENKDFFDAILKELNLVYSDIAFCFHSDTQGSICNKVIKYFSGLEVYKQYLDISARYSQSPSEYRLSSIYTDKNGQFNFYIQQDHIDAFGALLKKIPHTINFGFMGVVLDNIDWYVEETKKPTFCLPKKKDKIYDYNFSGYFSNSIRFFKEYDYGNKLNSVRIMIERKEKNENLSPYPTAFSQIQTILGKPKCQYLKCEFDSNEKEKWLEKAQKIDKIITENRIEDASDHKEFNTAYNQKEDLLDSVTPSCGFSSKTAFGKEAKKKGYKYVSFMNGCYKYVKKNKSNHTFIVEITNIPFSSFFEASVSAKGYNFDHCLHTINQATLKSETEAEIFAEKVFEIALVAEEQYAQVLFSAYGNTPIWFV